VRLAFAVAAHLEPDILVIDEVLAVGDAEFQKKAIGKMQDISKGEGRTVLFVSHNMDSVRKLCTRGIILEHGLVTFSGDINSVVDAYLSNEKLISSKDLRLVKDRSGNGNIIATKIEMINLETDNIISEIISGMDVKFRIHYQLAEVKHKNAPIAMGLSVLTNSGAFATVFNNEMVGNALYATQLNGYFDCIINKFPLTYGEFSIRLVMNINNETADWIENAFSFYVHDSDFYNTGNKNAQGRQGVYIDHVWS